MIIWCEAYLDDVLILYGGKPRPFFPTVVVKFIETFKLVHA